MRVALYIRIANDNTGDAISYQEQELRRWSNEHGHEVVDGKKVTVYDEVEFNLE